jgi:hypothetical protein
MGLVAEMRSGLEQCLHADVGGRHDVSPSGYTSAGPRDGRIARHRYVGPACGMRAHLEAQAREIKRRTCPFRPRGPGLQEHASGPVNPLRCQDRLAERASRAAFNKRFVACDRRLTLLTAEQNMNMLLKQRGGETNG